MILVYIGITVAVLLGLLFWSTGQRKTGKNPADLPGPLNFGCSHLQYLPQVKQALDASDYDYLKKKCVARVPEVRKERSRVALEYLSCLTQDYERLLETAQTIAAHSPEVVAKEEWKRFRLTLEFRTKLRIARLKFLLGSSELSGLENLASMVSSLELELERVVNEISMATLAPVEGNSPKY